jgi:seryl-tRNA(Sec) selenium transferase
MKSGPTPLTYEGRREEVTTRKHLLSKRGFEVSLKTGTRKAGCNVFTVGGLDRARC